MSSLNIKKLAGWLLLIAAVTFWASAFVAIRYSLASYHPGSLALLRYLVASVVMVFFYRANRHKHTPLCWRDLPMIIFAGLCGIGFYNLLLNYSELDISASVASFIVAQMPVLTTLFALFFLKEQSRPAIWFGMLFSVVGTSLIALSQQQGFSAYHLGALLSLGATFSATLYNIFQKPLLRTYNPVQLTCYAIWVGTAFLLFYLPETIVDVQHAPWQQTLSVVYLGVFPAALGYMIWTYALSLMTASRAVSVLYLSPILATLLGWWLLAELPSGVELLGGLIALLGAYVVNRR